MDIFLPLLLPPALPGGDTSDTGGDSGDEAPDNRYEGYDEAFAVHDPGDGGVEIECLDPGGLPETITVVTPQPCTLTFAPAGVGTLPDGSPAIVDTVVLCAYPDSVNEYLMRLPGRPTPAYWALTGVGQASFEALVQVWSDAASEAQLDAAWPDGSPATTEEGRATFRTQVLTGAFDVPLEAGVPIGDVDGNRLGLRIYDVAGDLAHPGLVLPDFDDLNTDLVWHPLIAAFQALDVDVQIFLRFQHLKVDNSPSASAKASFEPLVGVTVEVINLAPGNVIDTGVTDADGRVAFFVDNWDWTWGATADIYFKVTVPNTNAVLRQHGRRSLWFGTWSTYRMAIEPDLRDGTVLSTSGQPGYYPDYTGWAIGTASSPLEFNLGTPVILAAQYEADGSAKLVAPWRPFARGTEIQLAVPADPLSGLGFEVLETFYADSDGEVWGTAFDVAYGNDLEIHVPLAIAEDAAADFIGSASLPRVVTLFNPPPWSGLDRDPTAAHWAAFDAPAIGDAAGPLALRVSLRPTDDQAAVLFLLKCVRETHVWLRAITQGDWRGIEGAWVHISETVVTDIIDYIATWLGQSLPSMNPPSAGLLLRAHNKWDRDTSIHEFSHGVMWSLAPIGLGDFLCALLTGNYSNHSLWTELSEFSALVEGWSDLIANTLGGGGFTAVPATPPAQVVDASNTWVPFANVPLMGMRIEGCFAGAFWNWLHTNGGLEPCTDTDHPDPHLAGVLGPLPNTTITGAAADFIDGLWRPVKRLQDDAISLPGTDDLLVETEQTLGPSRWSTLETGYLKPWDMAP